MSDDLGNAAARITVEVDANQLSALIGMVTDVQERMDVFDNDLDKLEKKLVDAGSAARKAADGTGALGGSMSQARSDQSAYAAGFDALIDRLNEYNSAAREAAQLHVVGGGRNPSGAAAGTMSLDQAKEVLAITKAQGASAVQAAREVVSSEKRKQEAIAATTKMRLSEATRVAKLNSDAQSQGAAWRNANSISDAETKRAAELRDLRGAILGRAAAEDEATRASEKAANATEAHTASLPRLRYALYDVANAAGIVSAALTALGTAAIVAAASYESSFTVVERTSGVIGDEASRMREELVGLTRDIPQAFGDISDIAGRGAQLGVASENLEEFTGVVAKFVATSDTVTLDQAVESLGRISNLMGDSDFNAIGSSITLVGVNAAATEAQIVKTAQELSPFGRSAGFATDEIIGLATAVSSLGQPPERARSAFLSLQSVMDKAVGGLNDKLPAFANLLGVSADEAERLWQEDPSQFVQSMVQSLASTENMTVAMSDLGLTEKRASQVFQALAADANNQSREISVLDQAMQDANSGYVEGTELARQYALILDDLSSEWQLFLNGVTELAAALGGPFAAAAKPVLSFFTGLINHLTDFANTPVGAVVAVIVGSLLGLVGVIAGVTATAALATASLAAMATALHETNAAALVAQIRTQGLGAGFRTLAAEVGVSAGALRAFRWALISTGIGAAVVLLGTLTTGFLQAGSAADNAFDSFLGSTGGLADALRADATAYAAAIDEGNSEAAESYTKLKTKADEGSAALDKNAIAAKNTSDALYGTSASSQAAASGISDLTAVLGENTLGWLKNQLVQSEAFTKLAGDGKFRQYMNTIGADMDEFITISATKGADAGLNYLYGLEDAFRNAEGGIDTDSILVDFWTDVGMQKGLSELSGGLQEAGDRMSVTQEKAALLGITLDESGVNAEESGYGVESLASKYAELVDAAYATSNAQFALHNSLSQVGEELFKNGAAAAFTGQSFQAAIQNIVKQSGDSAPLAAANLQVLFDYIVKGGYASAAQLVQLKAIIDGLNAEANGVTAAPTMSMPDFGAIASGFDNAASSIGGMGSAAKQAAKEVRTLMDYASDLSEVWSRAFEIRFSGQSTMDDISSAWAKIRKESQDAAAAIKKYQAEMQTLNADKSTMQYWLMVAENYGDVLRAQELRAKLAEQDSKLADASKKLAAEQDKANKTLTGNSDAAIENRGTILSLVSSYQDHIEALASSGMSADDLSAKTAALKQQFIEQATQLGFSRSEVMKYAAAFDDVTTAISKIPRNITVKANANPAIQAFNEMKAAADKASGSISGLRSNAGRGIPAPYVPKARYDKIPIHGSDRRLYIRGLEQGSLQGYLQNLNFFKYLGTWQDGGYTGNLPASQIAGVAHGQEFVFSKPAVDNLGLKNLAMLHNAAKSGNSSGSSSMGFGGTMEVELSPYDRQLLVDVKNAAGLSISGDAITRAAVAGAANAGRTGRG